MKQICPGLLYIFKNSLLCGIKWNAIKILRENAVQSIVILVNLYITTLYFTVFYNTYDPK